MRKEIIEEKGRKFIALFFILFLMVFSKNAMAKELGHGFTLLIQKTSDRQIMDKFSLVKSPSIPILEPKLSFDVFSNNNNFFNIKYTEELKWVNKPNWNKFWKGAMYGALIGGSSLAILGYLSGDDESGWIRFSAGQKAFYGAIFGAVIGGIIGGFIAVF